MKKRDLQQIALLDISKEILNIAESLQILEDGFDLGISGEKVFELLTGCLESIKKIIDISGGTIVAKHISTGEETEVELDLLNPLSLLMLAIGIKTFLEYFPKAYMELEEEEIEEYIEDFFRINCKILNGIMEEVEEKIKEIEG